jgi:hypothetical protein
VFCLERKAPGPNLSLVSGLSHSLCRGKWPPVLEKGRVSTRGGGPGPEPWYIIEVGGPDFRIWGRAAPLAICGGKSPPVLEMGPAWTRGGGPRLEMGPSSTRGSGPSPASASKGRPWPSNSLLVKENAPPLQRTCPTTRGKATKQCFFSSGRRGKGHETRFFLEQEAPAPNLVSGTRLSHLLFVEESGP